MSDITVKDIDNVQITSGDIIQIESGLDNVDVVYDASALIDVDPDEYFLTSSGLYTGRLTGSIPIWIQNAIRQEIAEGDGNLADIVDDLRRYISTLENGVNQNITQIETTNQSLAALETSIVSSLGANSAAIYNLDTTKVTATEAQSIALNLQQSTFGNDADAYITNLAATYTDQYSAVAQDIELLSATYDDVNVTLSDTRAVVVSELAPIASGTKPVSPVLGQVWENTTTTPSTWWQYVGGTIGLGLDGWIQSTGADAIGAINWAGHASSFLQASDGSISGWEYADGSVGDSEFIIYAQNFKVSDGTNSANVPFSIVTGTPNKIEFNGIVNFTNTDMDIYDNSNVATGNSGDLLVYGTPTEGWSGWSSSTAVTSSSLDGYPFVRTQTSRDNYAYSDKEFNAQLIPLEPGETLYISGWVNTSSTTKDARIGGRRSLNGVEQSSWPVVTVSSPGVGWTYFEVSIDGAAGYTGVRPFTQINAFDTFGTIYWAGLRYSSSPFATQVAEAINNNTTTINGGRIDTSVIGTGVIYNTGANESTYTMKIDLNNGELHIK